ncbi:MAG TPA: hypothetical protein PL151_07460 [Phycisphaerae bacterium]|nr:hypothetical protein [Phycisphaerae bacterium]HOJ73196.1 hypothetical protein [Phycisphaerae bacterium]HOM51238.1 hypothetical protein [Phycisphaerae bacterium]HPP25366.1 hypothetical protein [Phycisphaerae bacterium]HPU24669.1 hypothetical protein [Phycisphaerae bacterium]
MPRQMQRIWATALLGAAVVWGGCAENNGFPQGHSAQASPSASPPGREPTPEEVARMLEPNVLGVSCFYDPFNPWIWNTEGTVVRGIRINALYLRGPNYTGVFGDGIIRPKLYVCRRNEQGEVEPQLVKEWSFDVEEAMPFRCKRRVEAGWGYALFLNWGDLDLSNQIIRLIVQFERRDGIVISGSHKEFRVPKKGRRA